ncbi:MAG: hypothetical protein P1U56_17035 [Saprospiraceae bacterium]|nr:hypothetical protein [Saprospiraceae bacterium]
MKSKNTFSFWSLILGGTTLVLFAASPYILDLIEPSRSIGQIIGENAKDMLNTMKGETADDTTPSRREIWTNILTITSFILLAITLIFSYVVMQNKKTKWDGIGGILLSVFGLAIYFSHLAIGLLGLIIIGILVVSFVVLVEA